MITVKYAVLRSDRHYEERTFSDLTALENWILDPMTTNKRLGVYFPDDNFRISFHKETLDTGWRGNTCPVGINIVQIENDAGIIFSSGDLTEGQKHCSKAVKEWLAHCEERTNNPQFNFVE